MYTWPDGATYEGGWRENKMHGQVRVNIAPAALFCSLEALVCLRTEVCAFDFTAHSAPKHTLILEHDPVV